VEEKKIKTSCSFLKAHYTMAQILAQIGRDHYRTILNTATNIVVADEPKENGGNGDGFSPAELLASALGTCTCVTLRMYADRKNFALDKIEVTIIFSRDSASNSSSLQRSINLVGDLTDEERQRLLQIANQCFIHKTLSNPIHIETALIPKRATA
jgi:putative redox protein